MDDIVVDVIVGDAQHPDQGVLAVEAQYACVLIVGWNPRHRHRLRPLRRLGMSLAEVALNYKALLPHAPICSFLPPTPSRPTAQGWECDIPFLQLS